MDEHLCLAVQLLLCRLKLSCFAHQDGDKYNYLYQTPHSPNLAAIYARALHTLGSATLRLTQPIYDNLGVRSWRSPYIMVWVRFIYVPALAQVGHPLPKSPTQYVVSMKGW